MVNYCVFCSQMMKLELPFFKILDNFLNQGIFYCHGEHRLTRIPSVYISALSGKYSDVATKKIY